MSYRARVRMYRHGLGDCFLVTLPRTGSDAVYSILIDCGVIAGTPEPEKLMQGVVADIATVTNHEIDLLIVTHEHWDHVSGFVQAEKEFAGITFRQVWLAWTEDPSDPLAKRIADERATAVGALQARVTRLRAFGAAKVIGAAQAADEVESVLSFFVPDEPAGAGDPGAADRVTTQSALEKVRARGKVSYRSPQDDPVQPDGTTFRLYVLGPPRDGALAKTKPSTARPDTYGPALSDVPFALSMSDVAPALLLDGGEGPFDAMQTIPTSVATGLPFFNSQYFGADAPAWRNIDSAELGGTAELALALDSATNDSCLVVAIELEGGDVLLFPGDAQAGNWLSWQDLRWTAGDKTVTGPDLLARCVLYKAGHHGSHNATLSKLGLERMGKLNVALIPVNEAMAQEKQWMRLPLPALVDALNDRAAAGVVRADKALPQRAKACTTESDLWYEVEL